MSTLIKIPDDASEKLEKASEILGVKKEDLVNKAVLVYLDNLEKYVDLKKELKMWDKLSDEALANFEKSL